MIETVKALKALGVEPPMDERRSPGGDEEQAL